MPTRFYFPSSTAADVTPKENGDWTYVSEALSRKLERTKTSTAMANGSQIGPWTAGQLALDRRYVSGPLAAQTISGTVKAQLRCREHSNTDNSTSRLEIYVITNDGSTVRGTLLAIGQYGPATELVNSATLRNKTFADGDSLSSLAISDGDRLVVAIGYSDATGSTPEATARYGDTGSTDLAENETETTDNVPWIEFSGTISEQLSAIEGSGAPSIVLSASGTMDTVVIASGAPSIVLSASGDVDAVISVQSGAGTAPPTDPTAEYDVDDAGGYTLGTGSELATVVDLVAGNSDFDVLGTAAPTRVLGAHGRYVMEFDSADEWIDTTVGADDFALGAEWSFIVEFKPAALPAGDETNNNPDNANTLIRVDGYDGAAGVFVRRNTGTSLMEVGGGGFNASYGDGITWTPTEAGTTARQYATVTYDSATDELRVRSNKGTAATATVALLGPQPPIGVLRLGKGAAAGAGRFDGQIGRVRIFDRVISDAESDAIQDAWDGAGGGGPTLALTATGVLEVDVIVATGAPTITLTASGVAGVVIDASGAPTLALTASGVAGVVIDASGAPTLALTASGAADTLVLASGAPTLALTASGSAELVVTGPIDATGAPTLVLTATGAAGVVIDAAGAPTLELTASGAANTLISASGAPTLALAAAGTAALLIDAAGAPTLELTASGAANTLISASGAPTLALTAAGTASLVIEAAGAASLALTAAGSAQLLDGVAEMSGAPTLALTAAGELGLVIGAAGAPSLALSAAGAAQTLILASGAASLTLTAAGAAESPAVEAGGDASLVLSAVGSIEPLILASGAASLTLSAAGAAILSGGGAELVVVPARGARTLAVAVGARSLALPGRSLVVEVLR